MTRRSFLALGTSVALGARRLAAILPPKLRVTKVDGALVGRSGVGEPTIPA